MPFLSVRIKLDDGEPKNFEILSLEQIVGSHIKIPDAFLASIKAAILSQPEKYTSSNEFNVFSPNKTIITRAPWTLIFGEKSDNRQLGLLLIGNKLFGVTPLQIGLKLQKSAKKDGPEKIEHFLFSLSKSIVEQPDDWTRIVAFSNINQ